MDLTIRALLRSSENTAPDFQKKKKYRIESMGFNLYPAKLNNLNFHPLEIVSRYRNPQLQVAENY